MAFLARQLRTRSRKEKEDMGGWIIAVIAVAVSVILGILIWTDQTPRTPSGWTRPLQTRDPAPDMDVRWTYTAPKKVPPQWHPYTLKIERYALARFHSSCELWIRITVNGQKRPIRYSRNTARAGKAELLVRAPRGVILEIWMPPGATTHVDMRRVSRREADRLASSHPPYCSL